MNKRIVLGLFIVISTILSASQMFVVGEVFTSTS